MSDDFDMQERNLEDDEEEELEGFEELDGDATEDAPVETDENEAEW